MNIVVFDFLEGIGKIQKSFWKETNATKSKVLCSYLVSRPTIAT